MSSWATATLAFGFDLGEGIPKFCEIWHKNDEGEEEVFHEEDIANAYFEWCALQNGVSHPKRFDNQNGIEWKEYREAGDKFQTEHDFEISTYGNYNNSKYFFTLQKTVQSGSEYSPTKVNTYPVEEKVIEDFCVKYNIPYTKPSWQLICMYS